MPIPLPAQDTANISKRNERLFYLKEHPELFTVEVIRERNPILVASVLGKNAVNDPITPDMNLADRMIYNLNHQARKELVDSVFGEEEEEEEEDKGSPTPEQEKDLEEELVKMSKELFLAGKMDGFNYELVERFQRGAISKEANQDLEDAYFDGDDSDDENDIALVG